MEKMQAAPEISVLMSVYNPADREIFLEAVKSVISQSFTDWEMILYDDGSDEDKKELIKEAAALDPRIIYVDGKENRGLGYAINASLGRSAGKYIARMDCDDISKPERFTRQHEFLEKNSGYAWVGTNAELIDSCGRWAVWRMVKEPGKTDFLKFSPFIHPSVMFRRQILEECGGYTQDNKRAEDYELFMRLYAEGYKGYNLQEVLFCYRENTESYRRRKFSFQLNEVKVRIKGFKSLGLLNARNFLFAVKPFFVGLIPNKLLSGIKRRVRKGTYVGRKVGRAA